MNLKTQIDNQIIIQNLITKNTCMFHQESSRSLWDQPFGNPACPFWFAESASDTGSWQSSRILSNRESA